MGLRVVELEGGAGVVLVVEVVERNAVAVSLVWNLLFLLPNLRLVEAAASLALSVVVEGVSGDEAGLLPLLICCPIVEDGSELVLVALLLVGVGDSVLEEVDDDDEDWLTETLVELTVGGLAELVTCIGCCGCAENSLETDMLTLDWVLGIEADELAAELVCDCILCEFMFNVDGADCDTGTGVTGDVELDTWSGDRVNPLPVFPSGVDGLPLFAWKRACPLGTSSPSAAESSELATSRLLPKSPDIGTTCGRTCALGATCCSAGCGARAGLLLCWWPLAWCKSAGCDAAEAAAAALLWFCHSGKTWPLWLAGNEF